MKARIDRFRQKAGRLLECRTHLVTLDVVGRVGTIAHGRTVKNDLVETHVPNRWIASSTDERVGETPARDPSPYGQCQRTDAYGKR